MKEIKLLKTVSSKYGCTLYHLHITIFGRILFNLSKELVSPYPQFLLYLAPVESPIFLNPNHTQHFKILLNLKVNKSKNKYVLGLRCDKGN